MFTSFPTPKAQRQLLRFSLTINDSLADGIAFTAARCEIYVATQNHVWRIPYHGERKASQLHKIADVRTGPVAPGTDGDVHTTTSVAFTDGHVYAAAGSSCNATMDNGKQPCTEVDPTRAAVSIMKPDGSDFTQRAKRVRNAIALAVNPDTNSLWIGGAGQDDLASGHPYEYLDDLSAHPGDADYGWPVCEENHHVYWPGYHCGKTVAPLVELPAYSTIIGATFYPLHQTGRYAFPSKYRGGLFAAAHGSWHTDRNGCNVDSPRVVFVADERRLARQGRRLGRPHETVERVRHRFSERLQLAYRPRHRSSRRTEGQPLCRRRSRRRHLSRPPQPLKRTACPMH